MCDVSHRNAYISTRLWCQIELLVDGYKCKQMSRQASTNLLQHWTNHQFHWLWIRCVDSIRALVCYALCPTERTLCYNQWKFTHDVNNRANAERFYRLMRSSQIILRFFLARRFADNGWKKKDFMVVIRQYNGHIHRTKQPINKHKAIRELQFIENTSSKWHNKTKISILIGCYTQMIKTNPMFFFSRKYKQYPKQLRTYYV